jgi:hypothetical protein
MPGFDKLLGEISLRDALPVFARQAYPQRYCLSLPPSVFNLPKVLP